MPPLTQSTSCTPAGYRGFRHALTRSTGYIQQRIDGMKFLKERIYGACRRGMILFCLTRASYIGFYVVEHVVFLRQINHRAQYSPLSLLIIGKQSASLLETHSLIFGNEICRKKRLDLRCPFATLLR